MRAAVLGTGIVGRVAALDLAGNGVSVIAADRDPDRLAALATSGVERRRLDTSDAGAVDAAVRPCDVVINALPYGLNLEVMRAALRNRKHYVDLGGLFHMTRRQLQLDDEFRAAGLTAVLGCGSAPGITNLMAKVAAARLHRLDRLDLRLVSLTPASGPFRPPYALDTLLDEFSLPAVLYRGGTWQEVPPLAEPEDTWFPPPAGVRRTFAFLHSELATLPLTLGQVAEVTYKAAVDANLIRTMQTLVELGFHRREPIVQEVSPRALLSAMLPTQDAADDLEAILVAAHGLIESRRVAVAVSTVIHPYPSWRASAGAFDTGVPAAIIAWMILDGTIAAPGVHAPESVVPAEGFFEALGKRGIQAHVEVVPQQGAAPAADE